MAQYTEPSYEGGTLVVSLGSKNRGMEGTVQIAVVEITNDDLNRADVEDMVNILNGHGYTCGVSAKTQYRSNFVPEPIVPDEPEGPPGGV